jgi:hypothetical protein
MKGNRIKKQKTSTIDKIVFLSHWGYIHGTICSQPPPTFKEFNEIYKEGQTIEDEFFKALCQIALG